MRRPHAPGALAVLLSAAALGCAPSAGLLTVPGWSVASPAPPRRFVAGAAREEITPPPGFPTGGHGPAGALARGQWGRLWARAFYFEDPSGRKLVLISSETFAVPRGLTLEVARRVADLGLHPEEIILAATHTHQGPGGFLTTTAYSDFGAARAGFDETLFRTLADRIARAVRRAHADAREHAGEAVALSVRRGSLGDLVRNRAPASFLLNRDRDEILRTLSEDPAAPALPCRPRCDEATGTCEPEGGWSEAQGCPRLRALDRNLTLLDVTRGPDGGPGRRIALLAFFAVHPTVLVTDASLYASDLTGVAVRTLEREWGGAGESPVVGFFNGAEGDVTTRRLRRDIPEVLAFAGALADRIRETLESPGRPVAPLVVRVGHRDADTRKEKGCGPSRWGEPHLSADPMEGASALGGAEGDRTFLWALGWKEGLTDIPQSGQGGKRGPFDPALLPTLRISRLVAPASSFPRFLPVTDAAVGDFGVVALPVEMTTAMAFDIRKRLGLKHGETELIGLAGEYASYAATPEEYVAQGYEGASTLWGPHEGPFLGCLVETLRGRPSDTPFPDAVPAETFTPGQLPAPPFGPELCGERRPAPDEGLGALLRDGVGRPVRDLPLFTWEERAVTRDDDFAAVTGRTVEVLEERDGTFVPRTSGGAPDDDRGFGLVTILVEGRRPGGAVSPNSPRTREWAALWLSPLREDLSGQRFRFRVRTSAGAVLESTPFTIPARPNPEAKGDGS